MGPEHGPPAGPIGMGHVTVTLNSRTYRLRCGDGEESRLIELATQVKQRVDALAAEFGNVGDDRLLLMAALLIADELHDARAMLEQMTAPDSHEPPQRARTLISLFKENL